MNLKEAQLTEVPQDWVMMVHQDIPESFTLVTAAAFNEVYEANGWQQADTTVEVDRQVLNPPDSPDPVNQPSGDPAPPAEADAKPSAKTPKE